MNKNMKNILWIHVDCFRSDLIDLIKKQENTELEGFSYLDNHLYKIPNCYSHAISTIYSVAGYLTGTFPFNNKVLNNDIGVVPENIKYFGEILREFGYHSKAYVTTGPKHDKNFRRIGFEGRAFDEIEFLHSPNGFIEDQMLSSELLKFRGNDIIGRCNLGNRMFTYVTLLDMHVYNGRNVDGKWNEYYEGVKQVDIFLKNILSKIDLDKTIIIVHGDHGFKFSFDQEERNCYFDFGDISGYEPLIKVGAYISEKIPIIKNRKYRIIDFMPTILDILKIKYIKDNINGKSLFSNDKNRIIYSEIGIFDNKERNIRKEFYLNNYGTLGIEIEAEKTIIPKGSNFSLLFDDYQIIFSEDGIPFGLFLVKNNTIYYEKNLIYNKELVLDLCNRSRKFIETEKFINGE